MNRAETAQDTAGLRGIERSLPLALLKAREAAMSHFRPMLRAHGLTEQQWRVIRILAAFPDIDASEIVQRSYLLAPSLTRILHYLESEKIIIRMQDETDLRRSYFSLTPKGRRIYTRVAPDSESIYEQMSARFGRDKLAQLYELLAEFANLGPEPDDLTD